MFPILQGHAKAIVAKVNTIRDNDERQDLKDSAKMYGGVLERKIPSLKEGGNELLPPGAAAAASANGGAGADSKPETPAAPNPPAWVEQSKRSKKRAADRSNSVDVRDSGATPVVTAAAAVTAPAKDAVKDKGRNDRDRDRDAAKPTKDDSTKPAPSVKTDKVCALCRSLLLGAVTL